MSFLSSKRYTVTYDIVTVSNIEDFRRDTLKYDHEETNAFLVFQAINNVTISSFSECCLYSSDTDDFLLVLVYCRPFLRNVTYGILILTFCMRHLKIQWGIKTVFMEFGGFGEKECLPPFNALEILAKFVFLTYR